MLVEMDWVSLYGRHDYHCVLGIWSLFQRQGSVVGGLTCIDLGDLA